MKLSKFLATIACVTFISLLYVYQQSEIYRLAYLGQRRETELGLLLDKNSILRYNIEKSASLVQIGTKVTEQTGFEMPQSYRLLKVAPENQSLSLKKKESLLSRLFGVKNQAEARMIGSSGASLPGRE